MALKDAAPWYKDAVIYQVHVKSFFDANDDGIGDYWHRFFAHQPDLNDDNPRVVEAVLDVMRVWLDCGVDGTRLDAVPYLFEREGTSCENLIFCGPPIAKLSLTFASTKTRSRFV